MGSKYLNRRKKLIINFLFLGLILTILFSHSIQAKGKDHNILILNSYHKGYDWSDDIMNGIEEVISQNKDVHFKIEYMDTYNYYSSDYFEMLYRTYKYKYQNANFDLIIASDNNAFDFIRQYREELFRNIPVVFCGVNNYQDSMLDGYSLFTGVVERPPIKETIDLALQLHPDTKQTVILADKTSTGKANRERLLESVADYNLEFTFLEGMTVDELQKEIKTLLPNCIIFFMSVFRDEFENMVSLPKNIQRISTDSKIPIYSAWDFTFGSGVVGGKMAVGSCQGRMAGMLAQRILAGEEVSEIPVRKDCPTRYMFDYKQLQRFNLDQSKLPEDSMVINQPESFYSNHKKLVLGTIAVIIALFLLIIFLVNNILKRRKAEKKLLKVKDELELKVEERTSELKSERDILQKYFDIAEVILLILDNKGRVELINKKGYNLLGCKPEEVIGQDWFDQFIKEEERDKVKEVFNKVMMKKVEIKNFENKILTKNGAERTIIWRNTILKDRRGKVEKVLSSGMDITERKQKEEKIRYINYHDSLTGLYNRKFYEEELARLNTKRQLPLSIIIGDVNGLKLVNDVFGHKVGDRLLKEVAAIIELSTRSEDIVARWGGDEFGIILPQTDRKDARQIIKRIKRNCRELEFEPIPLSIALGSATKSDLNQNIEKVFIKAENQMYQNKAASKKEVNNKMLMALEEKLLATGYETEEHIEAVRELALKLGEKLGLSDEQLDNLALVARLHDIGKLAVADKIFEKEGKLTIKEWIKIKEHAEIGHRIVKNFQELIPVANSILHHHEWWNGQGYPEGLKEKRIPLLSRIISIVDAYNVMINGRPYQAPISKEEAIKELKEKSGVQFDPELVSVFIEIIR